MKSLMVLSALALCGSHLGAQSTLPRTAGGAGARAQGPPNQEAMVRRGGFVDSAAPQAAPRGSTSPMAQPAVPADSYARYLLAPELVMAHQADINLTNDQRTRIATEMANAQSKFVYRQWLLANVEQVLEGLLKGPVVDETAVLKRTEEILLTEQDMKKIQMSLLVRVKNVLTPDQQAVLFALRPLYEAQGSAGQAVRGGGLGGGGRAMGSGGAGGFIGGGAVGGGTRGGRGGMLDTLRNPPPR